MQIEYFAIPNHPCFTYNPSLPLTTTLWPTTNTSFIIAATNFAIGVAAFTKITTIVAATITTTPSLSLQHYLYK